MDRRSKLVAAALLLCAGAAQAYVTPSPPPGFGGSPGSWTFAPSSPADQLGKIMRGPGPSVAGSGPMSAAYRLGPGAARALAKGVIGGGVAGALLLGGLWLAQNCFEKQGGQWVRTCGGTQPAPPVSDGLEYRLPGGTVWRPTKLQACFDGATAYVAVRPGYVFPGAIYGIYNVSDCYARIFSSQANANAGTPYLEPALGTVTSRASSCPVGWYVTDQGCVQTKPVQTVTPEQVEDEMAEKPLPQTLPPGIPAVSNTTSMVTPR